MNDYPPPQPNSKHKDSRSLYPTKKPTPPRNWLAWLSLALGAGSFVPFFVFFLVPSTVVFCLIFSLVLSGAGLVLALRSRRVSIHLLSTIGFVCSIVVLCVTLFIFLLALPIVF